MNYSILVTVYNDEQYLSQCFDSIISQTVRPNEIVVVNDNSTDRTGEIINEYGFKHVFSTEPKHENRWLNRVRAFKLGLESLSDSAELVLKVDADIVMVEDYATTLIEHFKIDRDLAACSGISNPNQYHSLPRNGAIMYRRSAIDTPSEINEVYGWDRWTLLWLLEREYKVSVNEDLLYSELRDSKLSVREAFIDGKMRRQEGYPLRSVILQAILQKGWKTIAFLNGYVRGSGPPRHDPEFIRQYSKKEEAQRMKYIKKKLGVEK